MSQPRTEEARQAEDILIVRVQPSDIAATFLQKLQDRLGARELDAQLPEDIRVRLYKALALFQELVGTLTQGYKLVSHAMTPVQMADTVLRNRLIESLSILETVMTDLASKINDMLEELYSGEGTTLNREVFEKLVTSVDTLLPLADLVPVVVTETAIVISNLIAVNADATERPGLARLLTGLETINLRRRR